LRLNYIAPEANPVTVKPEVFEAFRATKHSVRAPEKVLEPDAFMIDINGGE
jgi:hypothetical protein